MKPALCSSRPKISSELGGWVWPDLEHGPYFGVIRRPRDLSATHTYSSNCNQKKKKNLSEKKEKSNDNKRVTSE